MNCPVCGSSNTTVLTREDRRGFGICNSILGYICFGPFGLLCGLCGMGETQSVSYTLHCGSCGRNTRING